MDIVNPFLISRYFCAALGQTVVFPSSLWYKRHLSRQLSCWSLRCSWSIACRRCSNYTYMFHFKPGSNRLGKDKCKTRQKTFKFWDLVRLISGIFRCISSISRSKYTLLVDLPYIMTSSNENIFRWPFVRAIHWSPATSPHKGQWRGVLVFSFICAWTNGWASHRDPDKLRRHRAHYDDITIMYTAWFCGPFYRRIFVHNLDSMESDEI